ncbi:MAG: sigma-70 family RNA polymerase sigma factor [Bacteroidota bacterium]|nr:sigma-70 family RNA polymerase sigma factor [Bacteroidota bacterium]
MEFRLPGKTIRNKRDEALLLEFQSGKDLEVLGELYSRYMHLVYGVCLKYLKDREESKDAVMQIFEKLITEVPRHKIENFKSWLHVVTKNYCLMQLRSDRTENEKSAEWLNNQIIFMESLSELHPIDKDEDSDDEVKALEDCIERLKDDQKTCIRKFYFENRCYNEIVTETGLDINSVKSNLQNGKRNLKICLEEKNVGKR